ncbi:MAG: hypothetical protein H0V13_02945 [Nocardioidaceae bacterium]|jgi:hypothetical protein|nr:hypothetical protein [Nocardioidaceae bacterium]
MHPHVRAAGAGVALSLAVAAGCSSGDDDPATAASSSPNGGSTTATPTEPPPTLPGGAQDAASDLSSFECVPGPGGDWTATGVITSSAATVASFELTVVLAGADADNPDGRQRVLADLEPDVPTDFVLPGIPASFDGEASCHVQVLLLSE